MALGTILDHIRLDLPVDRPGPALALGATGFDRYRRALVHLGMCGFASVALDLVDHPLAVILNGYPLTWENLIRHAGRPLHYPVTVLAGLVCGICCALVARWTIVAVWLDRKFPHMGK